MLKLTLAATALMIVGSLLAQPQAAAAGRYTGPVTSPIYPYPIPFPTKLPKPPRLGGTDCTGVEQCATAGPIAPIVPRRLLPLGTDCSGVEQCATAPAIKF
jgi:hypothetical protein